MNSYYSAREQRIEKIELYHIYQRDKLKGLDVQ